MFRLDFSAICYKCLMSRGAVLGPIAGPRSVRIMVILPTEASAERSRARKLVAAGTDCVRVNCAHDDAEVWQKMISNVRAAASWISFLISMGILSGALKLNESHNCASLLHTKVWVIGSPVSRSAAVTSSNAAM